MNTIKSFRPIIFTTNTNTYSIWMKSIFTLFGLFFVTLSLVAQNPGFIYKPASSSLGRAILDPNGDGYTSATTSGFVSTGTAPKLKETNSELRMIPIPVIIEEPLGDPVTGGSGAQTDIVSAGGSESVYLLKRTVDNIDYLVVRFRLGRASNASKGFSFLLETDRVFGDPLSSNNLGFDREIVYETGNNGRIAIYKHELNNAGQLIKSYNVNEFSQRSYASSSVGGKTNVFYDFCVPIRDIDASDFVRLCAVTVTSAGSGITGTIADFNGIDDKSYGNDVLKLQAELMSGFPELNFDEMDENFDPGTLKVKTLTPFVNAGLNTNSTSISGTSREPEGTTIKVCRRNASGGDSTYIGDATVTASGTWSIGCTGTCATDHLVNGFRIYARAYGTNKTPSDLSNVVIVESTPSCFLPAPVIQSPVNGNLSSTFTWTAPAGFSGTVNIQYYDASNNTTRGTSLTSPTFTNGIQNSSNSWSTTYTLGGTGNSNGLTLYAIATTSNCNSGHSNYVCGGTGCGTIPTAPIVNTSPILTSTTTINVTNNHTAAAVIVLYKNGIEITRTASTVAATVNTNFTVSNLNEGERITARISMSNILSNLSNEVIVQAVAPTDPSPAPAITGLYFPSTSGNLKITGTSPSPSGATIRVYYKGNGVPHTDPYSLLTNTASTTTTTVNNFGQWEFTINSATRNLAVNDTLIATATESGKLESPISNKVVVLSAPPDTPTINGPILAGISNSLSGSISGSSDSVVIYIDGVRMGLASTSGSAWTFNIINLDDLYLDGQITAVNFLNGSPAVSAEIPVTGPYDFFIENEGGGNIPNKTAGVSFNITTTARNFDGTNFSTFTDYNTVNFYNSPGVLTQGAGPSANFNNGELTTHAITLTKAGTHKLFTVSEKLPTVFGSVDVTILPATAAKLTKIIPASKLNIPNQLFNTQPVVALTDEFGNIVTTGDGGVTASIISGTGTLIGGTNPGTFATSGADAFKHTFTNLSIDNKGQFIIKYEYTGGTLTGINPVYDTVNVANTKIWYGRTSTSFAVSNNWRSDNSTGTSADIPSDGDIIEFYIVPGHKCILDRHITLSSIIIPSNKNADSSIFDFNNHRVTLLGDLQLTNLGKLDVRSIDTTASTLILAGNRNEPQSLPKNRFVGDTIRNLTINNPNGVQMLSSENKINISGTLTFTSGVINTQRASNAIVFLAGASHSGAKASSHIEGKCSKVGNTAFVFPVGRGGKLGLCEISNSTSTTFTDSFSAEYFPINFTSLNKNNTVFNGRRINNGSPIDRTLRKVSNKEYWDINRKQGSSAVDVTLFWSDNKFSEITSLTGLTVVHFDNSSNKQWENIVGNGNVIPKDANGSQITNLSNVPQSGSITLEAVDDFSPFTFGDEDDLSLLDLQFLSLQVEGYKKIYAKLKWDVYSEYQNGYFEIQRSDDLNQWITIGKVEGWSNEEEIHGFEFIDYNPVELNYYRLIFHNHEKNPIVSKTLVFRLPYIQRTMSKVYPNPSTGSLILEMKGEAHYVVKSNSGAVLSKGAFTDSLNLTALASGILFIQIYNDSGYFETHKVLVIK